MRWQGTARPSDRNAFGSDQWYAAAACGASRLRRRGQSRQLKGELVSNEAAGSGSGAWEVEYLKKRVRLHDYFIARSIDLPKPGALAAFVTSHGTTDKVDAAAREHIAKSADLIAAIRLPEGSFRADAGADVVVDILVFCRRKVGAPESDQTWLDLVEVRRADGETCTCLPRDGVDLAAALNAAMPAASPVEWESTATIAGVIATGKGNSRASAPC